MEGVVMDDITQLRDECKRLADDYATAQVVAVNEAAMWESDATSEPQRNALHAAIDSIAALAQGNEAAQPDPTHEQMIAGYKVACSFGVYERRAFDLAEAMYVAMTLANKPTATRPSEPDGKEGVSPLPAQPEQPNPWREAVHEALIVNGLSGIADGDDPETRLAELVLHEKLEAQPEQRAVDEMEVAYDFKDWKRAYRAKLAAAPRVPEAATPSQSERDAERAALAELVAVEDLKEMMERPEGWKAPDWSELAKLQAEYKRRRPLALAAARAVVQGLSHSSEQDEKKKNVHQAESVPVASAQGDALDGERSST